MPNENMKLCRMNLINLNEKYYNAPSRKLKWGTFLVILLSVLTGCSTSNTEKDDISNLTIILHAGGGIDDLSYMNA